MDVYRLITTLLDSEAAPAAELGSGHGQRWEIETALDELQTRHRGPPVVLRSTTLEGVLQEADGYSLSHCAIRAGMHEAAPAAAGDPDHRSFTRSLRVLRRNIPGSRPFPP